MNIAFTKYLLIFTAIILSTSNNYGQILAPNADRSDTTAYVDAALIGNDSIYFFYSPNENGHDVGGDLTASYNDIINANYTWYGFSKINNAFDSSIFVELDVVTSVYTKAFFDAAAGYRVHIENSTLGIDTSWHAWVFLNEFDLDPPEITLSTCDTMRLSTNLRLDTLFSYRDLTHTDSILTKRNDMDSLYWVTNEKYPYELPKSLKPSIAAPTTPTKFSIVVKDIYGHRVVKYLDVTKDEPLDDFNYPQLRAVEAIFKPEIDGAEKTSSEADTLVPVSGQAPLRVQFSNSSKNAELYHWTFYNYFIEGDVRFRPDSVLQTSTSERPEDSILYTYPGNYAVKLTVEGPLYRVGEIEKRCPGKMHVEKCVEVDSVYMPTFMNVFTPNNDNKNDIFYFSDTQGTNFKDAQSIKEFSIKIYSRWGNRVHEYTGRMEDWQGWDGETIGLGKAKTGVYFYSVIYTGYDGKTRDNENNSFIHLFR